jgi:hypothetical protein
VEEGPNGGALFRVRLPAAAQPDERPARQPAAAIGARPVQAALGPGKPTPRPRVPMRDEDARREPDTNPGGIPVVPIQPGSAIR